MMMALQKSDSDQNYKHDLIKATEKLGKVRREEDIRSFVNDLLQRNGSHLYVSKVTKFFFMCMFLLSPVNLSVLSNTQG